MPKDISQFMDKHFRHFNSASLLNASKSYKSLVENNGKMMVTLAGAMSTAEIGKSLAEMIRNDKVHAICCTGANLEEDVFNLIAHNDYKMEPNYRELSAEQEMILHNQGYNRVTDTCIPEETAVKRLSSLLLDEWIKLDLSQRSQAPHMFFWTLFENKSIEKYYQIDPKDSWLLAAYENNIPIFTPGWEDSTIGNMLAAACINEDISSSRIVESGIDTMIRLASWYQETSKENTPIGFFQIGGGIAGDFPICVVPLLNCDLHVNTPLWSYFCQISDSTTSYGSYSGAVPNEKITWGKLGVETPKYVIESDATIVAPLIFSYVLDH